MLSQTSRRRGYWWSGGDSWWTTVEQRLQAAARWWSLWSSTVQLSHERKMISYNSIAWNLPCETGQSFCQHKWLHWWRVLELLRLGCGVKVLKRGWRTGMLITLSWLLAICAVCVYLLFPVGSGRDALRVIIYMYFLSSYAYLRHKILSTHIRLYTIIFF